jgi:hypothetical protein
MWFQNCYAYWYGYQSYTKKNITGKLQPYIGQNNTQTAKNDLSAINCQLDLSFTRATNASF